jgi:large subunit ribosomal protein L3
MAGLIGKKIGMTSVFNERGEAIPCTVIQAGPCWVTQTRTKENDGYDALQLGFGEKNERLVTKPLKGHFAKSGVKTLRVLREFKGFTSSTHKAGEEIKVDGVFAKGDTVKVSGISKGKGFQGVVKRHHFGGGSRTHGLELLSLTSFQGDEDGRTDGRRECVGSESQRLQSDSRIKHSPGERIRPGCDQQLS